jgi:hypothetical protein
MIIALTVLCRNEEDIINDMISFHLNRGVKIIIATDNSSSDSTREILATYEQQGVLVLLDEKNHIHDQSVWVSNMARIAVEEFGADWVIHADADEFWWPNSGNLQHDLRKIPQHHLAISIDRYNFLPPPFSMDSKTKFSESMTIRERLSLNSLGKPLPPKICHRKLTSIEVDDGNHGVRSNNIQICSIPYSDIEILHFPIRSYKQFEQKIRLGAEAIERNPRISTTGVGNTWRHIYHEHLRKGTLREYYTSLRPSPDVLNQLILEGELIRDLKLREALLSPFQDNQEAR